MDFSIKGCDWSEPDKSSSQLAKSDCIVVGVFEDGALTDAARYADTASAGAITRLMRSGDFDGKPGSTLLLPELQAGTWSCVLLAGLGKPEGVSAKNYTEAVRAAWRALAATRVAHVLFTLTQVIVEERGADWVVRCAAAQARDVAYRFARMKSKPEDKPDHLKKAVLSVAPGSDQALKLAAKQAMAIANGVDLTRDLGNLPPNVCTPTYLADTARQLADEWKLEVEVLGRKQIEALRMGAFLAVARGSVEPPLFIVLRHRGAASKEAPVVLVGKGITFDSGGISIKPGEAMDEMKYDMCGAGSVLGTMRAVAEMALPLNVIGVVPACENMPSGNATRPGDILTSMSGQTVEVLNTDAEGRLILCDALTYAERFKPAAVIDIATLTGACIIALGHHHSGLFSTDEALAAELLAAAKKASDPIWRMPLDDEYQEQLKSNFADMANIGGRPAGSVTAACFLSRFASAYPWAHLDIAGTAWKSGAAKGATGRPVPLLAQFLIDRAAG